MLTCVYQPPVPLGSKNCLIKVNRDTKKVIVSKFTEEKGGRVKVEVASTHKTLNQLLRSKQPKLNKSKNHHYSVSSLNNNNNNNNNNNEDAWESAYSSDSEPLSETCGLSASELQAMATRQARQLETQEQLLAAKAQRLRFLKSSGEAERLQRLREKVASQEERLRKLRALRGKVQSTRNGNSVLSADLESLRAVFNEKEKELSLAVAKVDELTQQLENIRRNGKDQPQNGQSAAAMELEKLRRELMYRHKLREAQSNRVVNQKQVISQRQEEAMRVDRRIAELQERLHRKRVLNSQLAASLKHQENVEDFVSLPTKNDPKYQTLPYNAKLFAPFANKHEQDQFEKSMQQMQIIQPDHPLTQPYRQSQNNNQHHQQSNYHQSNQQNNSSSTPNGIIGSSNNERIQSYNNRNNSNNLQQQLHNFLSQQQQQNNQQQQISNKSANSINTVTAQSSSSTLAASSSTTTTTSSVPNGLQTVHSTQANNNVSRGKAMPISGSGSGNNGSENTFPIVRPSNFLPTGAPASSPSNSVSSGGNNNSSGPSANVGYNGLSNSQAGSTLNDTSSNLNPASGNGSDGFSQISSSLNMGQGRQAKPALPPKPAKPTPPPRQAQEIFSFGQRIPSSSDGIMIPDRTELPNKSKPLFVKSSHPQQQNITAASGPGSNSTSSGGNANNSLSLEKESNGNSNNTTVRMSINRRIEMPPAFLFPESDPPPSDLVPEHLSSQSSSNSSGSERQQQQKQHEGSGPSQVSQNHNQSRHHSPPGSDSTDASPMLIKSSSNHHHQQLLAEEYTLPDLFPNPPTHNSFPSSYPNNNKGEPFSPNNNTGQLNSQSQQYDQKNFGGPMSPNSANLQMMHQHQQHFNDGDGNSKGVDSHVSVMNLHVGPGSPRVVGGSEESGQMSNNSNQLEIFEAVDDNGRNTNDQSPERDENISDSIKNNGTNSSVPGVLRRVKKSNFKSHNRDHIPLGRRVSFDPLALLLDASLEGELDLVMKTANEVGNVSAANDEGITALHNAICAGHADVVRFLVEFGCDVNAQDSDGWTPLHCAASCNNVGMVKFLVEHGACIFATTLSDHETAAQKCEEDEDGFGPCSEYLYSIQEKLGIMNSGVVYAVFEYDAQNQDELSFREGERLVILRKGDEYEREWWWAALTDKQGYVPRNLLGLYPRVVPQKRNES